MRHPRWPGLIPLQYLPPDVQIFVLPVSDFNLVQRLCKVEPLKVIVLVSHEPFESCIGVVAADDSLELAF